MTGMNPMLVVHSLKTNMEPENEDLDDELPF